MSDARNKLGPGLSAALDMARSLAAVYVVFHHVANANGWLRGLGVIFRFGQEAVLVFFLLSGFVIFANERQRALRPSGYYWRRFRRIYPALIVAMIVSTLVAIDNGDLNSRFHAGELFATTLSLQDISFLKPGVISDPYLGNDPLWSLSYEVAFYLVFPVVLRMWTGNSRASNNIIGSICCLSYISYIEIPNHFALVSAYFLVWWCGAMAADAYFRGGSDSRDYAMILWWLALLSAIAAISVWAIGYRGLGFFPFLQFRHFFGALVILMVLSNKLGQKIANLCGLLAAPLAFIASMSYGLYVLHYPILISWKRAHSGYGFATAVIILIVVAYFSDRKLNLLLPRAPRS